MQVYAGHRGGREKVAIKVMQVPGDHRERVLKEFSQESLLLSICYTDFVLSFRGARPGACILSTTVCLMTCEGCCPSRLSGNPNLACCAWTNHPWPP